MAARPDLPDYARYSTVGVEFAAIVGILTWLGHRLDGWLLGADSFPLFLLIGLFAGLVGGILRLNRQLSPRRRTGRGREPDSADEE